MNRRFQEYKECGVVFVDELDTGFIINVGEISFEPKRKKEKYNRAKTKREFEERLDEDLEL